MPPAPFFPPWYFWLFILAVNAVIFGSVTTIAVVAIRSSLACRIRERELTAELLERLLSEHHYSPEEIERLLRMCKSRSWPWPRWWERYTDTMRERQPIPPQKPTPLSNPV